MQLNLRVVEARGIPKNDILSESDPYCLVQISGTSDVHKTKIVNNTSSPVFLQEFKLVIPDVRNSLHLLVRDDDTFSADDSIGKLELIISSIPYDQIIDKWYPLRPSEGIDNAGEIHLVLHLASPNDTPFFSRSQISPGYMGGNMMPPPGAYPY